ncbi:phospholipid-translocating P-type ATPase [Neocallimastix californiae]|uniref:Phospholipid-transporting ATPase n=1 Tax=Neocallimastix californiae TaxID=1754190 RepID=A0A1Y2DPB3_9FUNG|nr:phospholipid-translocating P-type ATPase [Neocallimastix californiae]|eukprot:ORY61132.1 phospholipid-translocating P-type ATPase [Neocallimastix californiae]
MSTDKKDSNNESINNIKKDSSNNNLLNNEKSNLVLTITDNNIIEIHDREVQLTELNKNINVSSTSLNGNNFDDEIEENKIVYEINFPPTEEEIKPNANRIKTTKYNIFTFIPLNLWSQFHRFSNIYFLLGALSTLFGYTVVSPVAQIMPLIIVLSVTAIKDAYGDIKRRMDDKKANREPYYILRNNEVQQVLCKNIFPGDVIVIQKNEKIPADCLLLSSSNDDGVCYVETSDLDGETSLKKKTSLSELSCIRSLEEFSKIQGKIQCEPPCDSFSSFEGRLYFETVFKPRHKDTYIGSSMPNSSLSLNINQMLFRGSVLRNTDCVYLMAIYTGRETKVFRNSKQVGLKMSTLEPQLNRYLIYIFILNFIILLVSVVLQLLDSHRIIKHKRHYHHWYLYAGGKWNSFSEFLKSVLSFFALYTYFVPLSLFVTLEVVRIIQSWFFHWDHEMMAKQWVPMKVNSLNLGEDLGAIQYIFSDKTGTLTKNLMILTKWCIDGKIFDAYNEPSCLHQEVHNLYKATDNDGSIKNEEFKDKILEYCRALATCHEVMISFDPKSFKAVYESQSPDETAIVTGLEKAGIRLISRSKDTIEFQIWDDEESHEILLLTEFTSDRKCMTVIVKRETDKGPVYTLYTKGADDVISRRLSTNPAVNNETVLTNTMNALKLFGKMGYRVLMIAERIIDKETYETFINMYRKAECSLGNRTKNIAKALEYIEKDLILLGLTAVEDQLQDNIPETIDYLLNAGIKMWLLTGDQQDTAINIGLSSCLLNNNSNLMILNDKTYQKNKKREEEKKKKKNNEPYNPKDLTPLQRKFVEVGIRCRTVICCRVTPIQKANVVKAVRHNLKAVTLAIGDGANDVAMIQAAHIGVGIMGREGAQAVRASDYAFLEFRFLKPLLCVHGRYTYLQITKLILYSFYKNIVLSLILFSYGFVSLWSGNTLLENYFLLSYNLFYTCFVILVLACYERDVGIKAIYENPELYKQVKDGIYWSKAKRAGWIFSSIWHGLGK